MYYRNNRLFRGRCIGYAIFAYNFLKTNSDIKNLIENISVKKYKINFDEYDGIHDENHYYIEFTYCGNTYIIDNVWYYNKHYYKKTFKPKKMIKLKVKEVQELYKELKDVEGNDDLEIYVINDIIRHFNNYFLPLNNQYMEFN